ncbi:MAG: FAD-binding protein, partial [Burkholderiaceae bacterium]
MDAHLQSPAPERGQRQAQVVGALSAVLPPHAILWTPEDTTPYECDGLTAYRERPMVVVLPETEEQVQAVLRACHALQAPVVARGAGTGLSGGAMPHRAGVTLSLARFNRILSLDPVGSTARVQCGVRNLAISESAAPYGLYYAPDPSSQIACTIGGNVAENSGGVHCLKYGLTTNNILGLEIVLPDGDLVRVGGKHLDSDGYDLMGLMTGSEGLLGVVTEVTVRILRKPETARALLIGF